MNTVKRFFVSLLSLALVLTIAAAYAPALADGTGSIGTVTITSSGRVNVREGAGMNYAIFTTVPPGSSYPCLSIVGDWYEIQLNDGRIGFISTNLARLDANVQTGTVPVYYRTTDGRLLYTDYYPVRLGLNEIYANNRYVPAGYTLQSASRVVVNVSQSGVATPSGVLFIYAGQSASTTAPVSNTARVLIEYKDIYGSVLYTSYADFRPGSHLITANSSLLPSGYTLVGARDAVVSVSAGLVANPSSVTFLSVRSVASTQTPASAVVTVNYMTTGGTWLYTDYLTCAPGYTTISANDGRVPAGYRLYSGRSTSVYVSPQGVASPSAITFLYQQAPQNIAVSVPVYYRSSDGRTLATDYVTCNPGSNTVYANDAKAPGLVLQSSRSVAVYVSPGGIANPSSVVFTYSTPVSGVVTVNYMDNAGSLYFSEAVRVGQGSHTIYANHSRMPQGFVLIGSDRMDVYVNANGTTTPGTITFTYWPSGSVPQPTNPPAQPTAAPPPSGATGMLPLHQVASLSGSYPVYTGPGEWFHRVNANASVSGGKCRWYGTEGNWVMMGYQFGEGKYRIGFINKSAIPAGISVPELSLLREPVKVVSTAYLTDDPVIGTQRKWITTIPPGTTVTLLGFLADNDHWAYIETDVTGQALRGFINRVRIGR